ncbi:MAG: transporter substrate-binding domain-containing protein [Pseudomonas sp.]|uniref:substrate-binding periplasmic protein n=1 Tax=Pseudomonas sp. TaxID=306 RepID=UPI003397D2AA
MVSRWIGAWLLVSLGSFCQAATLTFCYEDKDSFPWVMTDGSGLNQELLILVEQALGLRIQRQAMPWKRCLAGLEQGHYDGAFAASFKTERLAMGVYPSLPNGQLDESRRLHTSAYSLYRRTGTTVNWNGEAFSGLSGKIGSLSGFSIVDFLLSHGAEVDETSRDPLALLNMLKGKRIQAAALQSLRADFVLKAHPELALTLEKLPQPLESKAYYLMLSKALVRERPELAQRLWNEIARQRESPPYQRILQNKLAPPAS